MKYNNKYLFSTTLNSNLYLCNNKYIIKQTKRNNQYKILNNIKDKNIIEIIDNYKDNKYNYDVMRYYPKGDIYDYIKNNNIIDINKRIEIYKKLIKPIYILHKNNIVHLDLKLENYLLDINQEIILTDFDYSKYHNSYYTNLLETNIRTGTKYYCAPELNNYLYSKSSDIYSLGCILYLLLTNTNYKYYIDYKLLKKKDINKNIIEMLEKMLDIEVKNRPTIFDIKYYYLN